MLVLKKRVFGAALSAFALVALATAPACGNKAKKESKDDDDHDHEDGTDTGGGNPCLTGGLGLQDTGTGSATSTDTATATGSSTDTVGMTSTSTGTATLPTGGSNPCGGIPTSTGTGTPSTGGNWNNNTTLESCNEQGKSWIAVVNKGPSQCGDALAAFCCTVDEAKRQFPLYATQLQQQFDIFAGHQNKLYNCSVNAAGATTFHFGSYDASGMHYEFVSTPAGTAAQGGASTGACPAVTSADLGIPAGGVSTGTGTATGTGTGTDTSSIPSPIGPLLSTAKADLVAYLEEGSYRAAPEWKHDAAPKATTDHGKMRVHMSQKLAETMTTFVDHHEAGSVAIGELFGDDEVTSAGFVVLGKATDGLGKDTWFFYEIKGAAGALPAEPSAYALGSPAACVTCHEASAKDFILGTLPP
jgi:hypothetical protein